MTRFGTETRLLLFAMLMILGMFVFLEILQISKYGI